MQDSVESYMTQPRLRDRWAKVGRAMAFRAKTRAEWRRWRAALRAKLRELLGYDTLVRAPLRPRVTEEIDFGDYVRQRVEIQTEPGLVMTLYVLVPRVGRGPFPAVIAAHGHGSGGKLAVAGCRITPEIADLIAHYNYDYGVQFVRQGFIVFCPDARGFGERQEKLSRHSLRLSSCLWINNMAIPLGQTITGMWAWDIHRLIDYIATRPDCRRGGVGCGGLSGGGLQTLWAAALDDRIRCAVISGYMYGYKESLLDLHGNCACNYVPHLYEYADMGDLGALIAPRPLLIETGNRDPLNGASGLGNVLPQVAVIRKAYRLLGAEDRLYHDIFDGEHRWNGAQAMPWMKHWMGP